MFTKMQELQFNGVFLQQTLEQAKLDLTHWKDAVENLDVIHVEHDWKDPQKRPSNVITMVAWTNQFLKLLSNRLQQNKCDPFL